MRLWNLNELDFEDNKDILFRTPAARKVRRPRHANPWIARFTVTMGIGVFVGSFSVATNSAAESVKVPMTSAAIIQNIPERTPPLSSYFRAGFDNEWSMSTENDLLGRIEAQRIDRARRPNSSRLAEVVSTVGSNQKDDLADASDRLSQAEVEFIVRGRKLVK
jgi:hypothetical protein